VILTGSYPFDNKVKRNFNIIYPKDAQIPDEAKVIIESMLVKNPMKRKTCDELLSYDWLKD
jgi:serine/threonine protein kinase